MNDPKRFATVTVENAAARIAAGENVRLEIGSGTAPSSFVLLAVLTPKDLAKQTTFRLPQMHAGASYATRQRAEKRGMRPGPYTAPVPIILEPLAAPTALSATSRAGDASVADVAWTPGELKVPAELRVRVQGRQSWRTRFAIAGSAAAMLDALKPGTTYELEVRHRELPPYKGVSAAASVTFTTGADVRALLPPTDPTPFVNRNGTFGMEVTAAEVPTVIAFEVAVELAPDSGTFGDYRQLPKGVRSAVQPPGRTQFSAVAAADGRNRRIRARAERHGATPSDWCAFVEVLPYSAAADGTPTTRESRRKHGPSGAPTPPPVVPKKGH